MRPLLPNETQTPRPLCRVGARLLRLRTARTPSPAPQDLTLDILADKRLPPRFKCPYVRFFQHVCAEDPAYNKWDRVAASLLQWLRTLVTEMQVPAPGGRQIGGVQTPGGHGQGPRR